MSPQRIDRLSVLQSSALLSNFSADELRLLAECVAMRRFAPGELLFSEGELCSGLYIIARGRVRIFKTSASGREQVLGVNGPGETVAELPVFDGGCYPASVVALEETEIAFIAQPDFRRFCLDHPEVALKLLATVGSRLRQLVGIIEELSFTTVRQRLVAMLLKLAESRATKTAQAVRVELPGTHQELAHQMGTVRELISRNLQRLQAEGLIEVDARQIVVRDVAALRAALD